MTNESNPRRRQQMREAALHQLIDGYGRTDHILVPQRVPDEDAGRETSEPAVPAPPAVLDAAATPRHVAEPDMAPRLRLFDPAVIAQLLESVEAYSKFNERRVTLERSLKPFTDARSDSTGAVPLAEVSASLELDLQRLRASMPNFARVIDAIEPVLQLQRGGDRALRMPPLLLLGPPGVGKSYFAEQLAHTLRLHYAAISLETTTAVWVLSGSSQGWSGGGPGIVFNTLASAPHANPLILLDEIDKTSDSRYPPINALYRLLEPHSAARFCDEAFPALQLDASAINWVITANAIEPIPAPLRSRMQCFDVPEPNAAQRQSIIAQIYCALIASEAWGHRFAPTLDAHTLRTLAGAPGGVRDLRRTLIQACAYAQTAQRDTLTPGDAIAAMRINTATLDLAAMEPAGHA